MTREELLNKEVIKVKDIMSAFDCNYNKATQIIRAIKSYNDRLDIRGAVHVLDYMEYWEAKSKHKKNEQLLHLENLQTAHIAQSVY